MLNRHSLMQTFSEHTHNVSQSLFSNNVVFFCSFIGRVQCVDVSVSVHSLSAHNSHILSGLVWGSVFFRFVPFFESTWNTFIMLKLSVEKRDWIQKTLISFFLLRILLFLFSPKTKPVPKFTICGILLFIFISSLLVWFRLFLFSSSYFFENVFSFNFKSFIWFFFVILPLVSRFYYFFRLSHFVSMYVFDYYLCAGLKVF